MNKRHLFTLVFAFLFGLSFFGLEEASALTLSPAKIEISEDPGSYLEGEIILYNEKNTEQTFYTSFENFEPSDDSGRPKFVGADEGLATWFSMQDVVNLKAKERKKIPFNVHIPSDAEPGGYFAAIFFGTQPENGEQGQVSIGGRLGSLVLMRVNGDIPEDGGPLNFGTLDSKYFYDSTPISFEYRFSNDGGDYITPRGEITIKNTFGSVKDKIDANPQEGSILPSSARKFKLIWADKEELGNGFFAKAKYQLKNFKIGFYSAEMTLGWGYSNNTDFAKARFLILPWQLLTLVFAFLTLVYFIIKFAGRSYKKKLMKQLKAQVEKE